MGQDYEDIRYETDGPVAVITIDRPERYNAFRGRTVEELIHAFRSAWADKAIQAVILTGAGEKAFCTGGDVKQRAETGDYGPTESGMFEIGNLHKLIRDIPKPVIAAVNGVAVGGGHVLHVLCDISHRQRDRPLRSGRPAGRLVRRRVRLGLPGAGRGREEGPGDLVPLPDVHAPSRPSAWAWSTPSSRPTSSWTRPRPGRTEIAEKSPTAIRFLKQSFNADTDHQAGLSNLAMSALDLFTASPEGLEGAAAFAEKRKPDFASRVISH